MKRQRSKNGRCLLCNITKTDQIHDADRNLCDDNMYKKRIVVTDPNAADTIAVTMYDTGTIVIPPE